MAPTKKQSFNKNSWKINEVTALLALYQSERNLFDRDHECYYDYVQRDASYSRIQKTLCEIRPFSVIQIKSKIKILRRMFLKELHRRHSCIKSGLCSMNTYKPLCWFYGLMQFLEPHMISYKGKKELSCPKQTTKKLLSIKKKSVVSALKSNSRNLVKKRAASIKWKPSHAPRPSSKRIKQDAVSSLKNTSGSDEASACREKNVACETQISVTQTTRKHLKQETYSSSTRTSDSNEAPTSREKNIECETEVDVNQAHEPLMAGNDSACNDQEVIYQRQCMANPGTFTLHNEQADVSHMICRAESESGNDFQLLSTAERLLHLTNNLIESHVSNGDEVFGKYIASEMRFLKQNPVVYLKAKHSILSILMDAVYGLNTSK